MSARLELELPLPPKKGTRPQHPKQATRWKNEIKRETWLAAIQQATPVSNPPRNTLLEATYVFASEKHLWDQNNLHVQLWHVIDALAVPDQGERVQYRQRLYERKGYYPDDSEQYLTIGDVDQRVAGPEEEPHLQLRLIYLDQLREEEQD